MSRTVTPLVSSLLLNNIQPKCWSWLAVGTEFGAGQVSGDTRVRWQQGTRSSTSQVPGKSSAQAGAQQIWALLNGCWAGLGLSGLSPTPDPVGFVPSALLSAPGSEDLCGHGLGYPLGAPPAQGHQRAWPGHRGGHQAVQQICQACL